MLAKVEVSYPGAANICPRGGARKVVMNILGLSLGVPKEKRTQLFFRDDGKFVFRKLFIEDTFLVEKVQDDIIKGWKHFYKLQFPFAGLKGISPDMVTLGFDRDIILDLYSIVDDKDKPDKLKKINENDWITDVADGQRYKAQNKPRSTLLADKITIMIGACVLLLVLAMAARGVWA